MTIIEALKLAIAADDAFNPDDGGPAYELIDAACLACQEAVSTEPFATGLAADAAWLMVAWDKEDRDAHTSANTDWDTYDNVISACRLAVGRSVP